MSRGRFLPKALLALVLVGLLVSTVAGIFGIAWWRGHRMAEWTAEGREEAAPHLRRSFVWDRMHRGPRFGLLSYLCGSWFLLKLVLVLLLISFVGRLFRRRAWRRAYGPWGMYGPRCWHHWHMHHEGREASFRAKVRSDSPDRDADAE